ncbi:uncharacterized protein LOC114283555 [Camellia sinensis]|uniref:uncharacterized protein LOC114283555 n=1 Tax=Camellia sinensis TaxID=4442 RepID=UPI001036B8EE|nr:uncharacterized protein LOC114283555 [Camellia sinensis]
MEPSLSPIGMKMDDSQPKLIQNWHKNGECPQGTIPIRRTQNHDFHRTFPSHWQEGQHYYPFGQPLGDHEYAFVSESGSTYYGAHTSFNVWNPKTEANEFSLSQIWVISDVTTLNIIEAGWMVQDVVLGYWPGSIFIDLADSSTIVTWGGEIANMYEYNNFARSLSAYVARPLLDKRLNAIGPRPSLISQDYWDLISSMWVGS